jgi:putative Mg2+ transporter-C (MgtC) family protein
MEWLQHWQSDYDMILLGRVLLAAVLGAMIGFEREIHGRPAGFRTHVLVTMGACLMTIVSEHFYVKYGELGAEGVVRLDPGRVAAQIVTGIGFLGAGAIIKERQAIRGLTTAACLWLAAGLGMAVGVGLYQVAMVVTALALFNLLFLKRIEQFLKKDRYRTLVVHSIDGENAREGLERFLAGQKLQIVDFGMERDNAAGEVRFDFILSYSAGKTSSALPEAVSRLEGVKKVRFH